MLRALLVGVATLALAGAAWGVTYTVTTNADAGTGSLRWAIEAANGHAGPDRILFDPSLAGKTIPPKTPLPALTDKWTKIIGDIDADGAPDIILNGVKMGRASIAAPGLVVRGARECHIVGLAIVRFEKGGILLDGASYCVIHSCHVGVNLPGTHVARNGGHQIRLWQSDYNVIGGPTAEGRNIIAAGSATPLMSGIMLAYSSHNIVRNNNIGIARDGQTPLTSPDDSGVGITLYGLIRRAADGDAGAGTLVTTLNYIGETMPPGGDPAAPRNVFGGMQTGIDLCNADTNVIRSNYLGLARDGSTHVPIAGHCIRVRNGSSDNKIGGHQHHTNVISGGWIGVRFCDRGTDRNSVGSNYFGLNAAGNHQRPLARGIECVGGAGRQYISYNVVCGKHAAADTVGIIVDHAGSLSQIRNNDFGLPIPAVGFEQITPHHIAIVLQTTDAWLDRNRFYGSKTGVSCHSTEPNNKIMGSTFDGCGTAVELTGGAYANLGNLRNTEHGDDGGNKFLSSNTWYIRNNTSNLARAEGNRFPGSGSPHAKIWDSHDDASLGLVDIYPRGASLPVPGPSSPLAIADAAAASTAVGAEVLFTLSAPAAVTATVRNIAGRPVRTICRGKACDAGTNALLWDAQADNGLRVPNGIYLISVTASAPDGQTSRALATLRLNR